MNDRAVRTAQNKLSALARQREAEIDAALRDFMSRPQGRRAIYWVLSLTNVGKNPFTSNALTTAFECGQMNVGQAVLARIQAIVPEAYLKMIQEQDDDRRADASTLAKSNTSPGADPDSFPDSDADTGTEAD